MAGRLGADVLYLQGRPWREGPHPVGGSPADPCADFRETGYRVCDPFLRYWRANGGLERFGYPISGVHVETNADGWTGQTMWFERRRMEWHGEGILLGLLGTEVYSGKLSHAPTPRARDLLNGTWWSDGLQCGEIASRLTYDFIANTVTIQNVGHTNTYRLTVRDETGTMLRYAYDGLYRDGGSPDGVRFHVEAVATLLDDRQRMRHDSTITIEDGAPQSSSSLWTREQPCTLP
jgi:hypothetical protein